MSIRADTLGSMDFSDVIFLSFFFNQFRNFFEGAIGGDDSDGLIA